MKRLLIKMLASILIIVLTLELCQSKVNQYALKDRGIWNDAITYLHLYMVDLGEKNGLLRQGTLDIAIQIETQRAKKIEQ